MSSTKNDSGLAALDPSQ